MGYIIKMPKMGLEMEEGKVVSWEVAEGESVESGDVIAIVESEKAANDLEARESGVVRQIIVAEGGDEEPGEPIGIFGAPDEDISALVEETTGAPVADNQDEPETAVSDVADSSESTTGTPSSAENVQATPGAKELAQEQGVDLTDVTGTGPQGTIIESDITEHEPAPAEQSTDTDPMSSDVKATPGAKDFAADRGVDLTGVSGSGPQGVVTEADVQEYAAGTPIEANQGGSESMSATVDGQSASRTVRESSELSGIQRTVSDRMSESDRNAAHVTLKRSFDASTMSNAREAASGEGIDVSFTDILVRAVGAGLAAHPDFNALFEDDTHKLVEEVNIGVAVDVEDGLLTPVIPSVASRSVEEVSEVRGELTDRALSGDFSMDDLSGGTFTITNLGMFDIDSFDPIINPPEVAILGVGRIRKDGTMTLSLSFDHRVVNGADAARFLDTIVTHLTDPTELLDLFEADLFERYALEN